MQWIKTTVPFDANGRTHQDSYTAYTQKELYQVVYAGSGKSSVFCNEELHHWIIGLCIGKDLSGPILVEPTYRQKVMILEEIGVCKKIALEVMPPEMEVVDRENVYHMWEFEFPYSFHYGYAPILDVPEEFENEIDDVTYHIKSNGFSRYLYLKSNDGKELTWRKKQNLKNKILSPMDTAVEIITREMLEKDYTCLVCLPEFEYLDFKLL